VNSDPPQPERQSFGPWVVTATRDSSGKFLNCTAFGVHGTDQLILSYYPDDAWDLSVYRGQWALDTGAAYQLSLTNVDAALDAPGTVNRPVEALEASRILLELDRGDPLISRLESGRELHIRLGRGPETGEHLRYPLGGAAHALAATRECTARNVEGT
jgi:hypothetical protein